MAGQSEPAAAKVEVVDVGLGQLVVRAEEEVEAGSRLTQKLLVLGERTVLEVTGWLEELSGCSVPKTKQKGKKSIYKLNPFIKVFCTHRKIHFAKHLGGRREDDAKQQTLPLDGITLRN